MRKINLGLVIPGAKEHSIAQLVLQINILHVFTLKILLYLFGTCGTGPSCTD